ncbi:MAG: TRAP transporter substrate-binding protein [Candidatus Rokubacteria bacterium]|nr:TRAP transporter substrate-binding protein [Candidatus Rokubacteria bacterium]
MTPPVRWIAAVALVAVALGAPAASAQEIKLKLSHFVPPAHNHHKNVLLPWVEEVRKRTGGRVEITIFPGASLCKPPQQYDCARDGIADIAWAVTGWTPGRFPMTSVVELPFMMRTAATGSQMLADLWDKYLKQEYQDVHVLFMNVHPAGHIHTSGKPVRALDDLKGLKIRTPTATVGDLLEMLGAAKVGMPITQVYESMSNRVIDGFVVPYEVIPPMKLAEVSKYHTEIGMYTTAFATMMNKKKYESLPADVRRVLDETTSAKSGFWKKIGASWDAAEVPGKKAVLDRKNEVHVVSKEDRRKWRDAVRGLDEKWASDMEKRGLPAKAILKEARGLAAKYGEAD